MIDKKNLGICETYLMKCVDNYLVTSNLHNINYTTTSLVSCRSTIIGLLDGLLAFEAEKVQAKLDFNPRSLECESSL